MNKLVIQTSRLDLIAATLEMGEAELTDVSRLARLLDAEIPENWPPPENDENTIKWFLDRLKQNPLNFGWLAWYMILKNDDMGKRITIGGAGFKGLPDDDGVVETGYSVMPHFQRQGFASEALKGLLRFSFHHAEVKKVIAETLVGHEASIGVMTKNNFRFVGRGSEEGTIRYEITREDFRL